MYHSEGQGADTRRLDYLSAYVRSALEMGRLMLDEVLAAHFGDDDPDEYRALVGKAGGELAMLLRLARRVLPGAADSEQITGLARDLAPLVRAPHVYRSLVTRPSRAPMHALAHLCLVELGVPDERLDRLARLALSASVHAANERVPYRMLDAAWTRHLAYGDAELDHPAIGLSPLGAGVDLLAASTEDAYAFTHALPYATDFGRLALPAGLAPHQLLGMAEALAVKALDEDDLDLLAEVLMAPAILRVGWTPTLAFAWDVLDRAWQTFGFVPGPGLPPAPGIETRTQAVRRVLGTIYHTTFAAGLCCATLLACQALPPSLAAGPPGKIAAPPGGGSAWKASWDHCSEAAQERLLFLRLAFALCATVKAGNLVALRATLVAAAGAGLIEHPLFFQAVELLERASI
jgi:hypothetical protein